MGENIDKKIIKLLEILQEEPEKGFNENKLLKNGFDKKDLDKIYSLVTKTLGVPPIIKVINGKETIWKLSLGWENYWNKLFMREIARSQKESSRKLTNATNWLAGATIVLVLFTFFFGIISISDSKNFKKISEKQNEILNQQAEISKKQTEILDRTSQSIRADLIVFSTRGYRKFPLNLVNNGEVQTISLTVKNMGKSTAPYAKIPIAPYDLFIGQYEKGENVGDTNIFYINQLESLGEKSETLYFVLNSNEPITPGVKNLTMLIYCDSCNEQKKYQIIPICLYSNDSTPHSDYFNVRNECGTEWI